MSSLALASLAVLLWPVMVMLMPRADWGSGVGLGRQFQWVESWHRPILRSLLAALLLCLFGRRRLIGNLVQIMMETKVTSHSSSRIAFLIAALLVARVGVAAEEHRLLLVADPSDGPIDCGRSVAHYNRGVGFQEKGDLEGAIREYRLSISLCSTYWRPAYNLGTVFQTKGDLDAAAMQYRNVIRDWPKIWQAHLELGHILDDKGDLDGAIEEYRAAIKRHNKYPGSHYSLGHALQAKGDLEGAIVEYRAAIHLQPDYPEAQSAMAEALKARGKS
jgi:tetratricopeptide (TPR) repeat protein